VVVHREDDDAQIAVFEEDAGRSVDVDLVGLVAESGGVGDVGAVVGEPVGAVDLVREVEPVDDLADTCRSVHWRRRGPVPPDPGLQQELAESVDVVGVEVGDHCGFDPLDREPHALQIADAASAGVEHERPVAGDHADTRPGPQRVGHRRPGTRHEDVQSVGVLNLTLEETLATLGPATEDLLRDDRTLPREIGAATHAHRVQARTSSSQCGRVGPCSPTTTDARNRHRTTVRRGHVTSMW
jgi:hypothetical protein